MLSDLANPGSKYLEELKLIGTEFFVFSDEMNDKDGDTFDEAVEERVINEEYKVRKNLYELT